MELGSFLVSVFQKLGEFLIGTQQNEFNINLTSDNKESDVITETLKEVTGGN